MLYISFKIKQSFILRLQSCTVMISHKVITIYIAMGIAYVTPSRFENPISKTTKFPTPHPQPPNPRTPNLFSKCQFRNVRTPYTSLCTCMSIVITHKHYFVIFIIFNFHGVYNCRLNLPPTPSPYGRKTPRWSRLACSAKISWGNMFRYFWKILAACRFLEHGLYYHHAM